MLALGISSGCFLSRLNLLFKMSFILAVCFTDFHFCVNSAHLNRGPTYTSPFFSSLFPLSKYLQSPGYHQQDDLVYPRVKSLHVQPGLRSGRSSSGVCCGWNTESTCRICTWCPSCGPTPAVQWSFHWLQSGKLTGLPGLRRQNTHEWQSQKAQPELLGNSRQLLVPR